MTDNPPPRVEAIAGTFNIVVVPCEITAETINQMYTSIGNRIVESFTRFTYSNTENNVSDCGAITFELLPAGDTNYLTLDDITLTFYPRTTAD